MPTTDSYGQGIQIASLTDAPSGAQLAADLAAGLVPRSAMRFASAAARNATITAPAFGMLAAITAEGLLTWYDGTQWVVIASGTSTWTTLTLAAGFGHNGNSQGDAQYRILNFAGELSIQLRGGISLSYSGGLLANSGVITASPLPTSARPTVLRTTLAGVSFASSTVPAFKLDAQQGGHLRLIQEVGSTPAWAAFNGIIYSL